MANDKAPLSHGLVTDNDNKNPITLKCDYCYKEVAVDDTIQCIKAKCKMLHCEECHWLHYIFTLYWCGAYHANKFYFKQYGS